MIFVTVGNSHHGSVRLLQAMDRIASARIFPDSIMIQSGNNPGFRSDYCQVQPFVGMDEFQRLVQVADVVVCHAGAGTISAVLQTGKTPVVVPRRLQYEEVIDDHQIELCEAFAARRLVISVYEVSELPAAIQEARTRPPVAGRGSAQALDQIRLSMDDLLGKG